MNVIAAPLVEAAPAKINLALHVTGRRADGYHLLESLVVFAAFGDRVEVRPASEDHFFIGGRFGDELAADSHNLVLRARDALRQAVALKPLSQVSIHLEKTLPIASGVGGGSSDAAAALRLLNRLWGTPLSNEQLAALARQLGADVPMCLAANSLIAHGIGDRLEPVALPALAMVLVNPVVAVSTPQVFGRLESRENPPLPPLPRHSDFAGLVEWLIATRNDLEAPARQMAPVIGDALDALASSGAAFSRMSGSGATCFGLFATPSAAQAAATTIRHARPNWFVEATTTN